MPDGLPIFCTLACPDPDHYDGYVHHAFIQWLSLRGWLVEEYDVSAFLVVSKAQYDESIAAWHASNTVEQ